MHRELHAAMGANLGPLRRLAFKGQPVVATMQVDDVQFRLAADADVAAMAECRSTDPSVHPADARMAAYFRNEHHPQQALPERVGFVALISNVIIGYIAGHRTTRHGCAGEVQYLFVAPAYRRRGVATALLRRLAEWFESQSIEKVCVCVDADSPAARPFYDSVGAVPTRKHWRIWDNIAASSLNSRTGPKR